MSSSPKPDPMVLATADTSDSGAADTAKKTKKRKRTAKDEPELEIDLTLPEPPSKKEARRAKKVKPSKSEKKDKSEKKARKSKSADGADNSDDETKGDDAEDQPNPDDKQPAKRSPHSIWIGNLPWTTTKDSLKTFFEAHGSIPPSAITRIHMPVPAGRSPRLAVKPTNKGFAYVDFEKREQLESALELSESLLGGRAVLIKRADNFAGRPEKPAEGTETTGKDGKVTTGRSNPEKPPSRRVFVGNLGFDVTKQDLEEHYAHCGEVVDVHLATFEDTGKCKGFAWVTFKDLSAGEDAVRGYTYKPVEESDSESSSEDDEAEEKKAGSDAASDAGSASGSDSDAKPKSKPTKKAKKAPKPRKWFVNRLHGRTLRVEFAEDASVRYKKRFGGKPEADCAAGDGEGAEAEGGDRKKAHDRRREARRAQRDVMLNEKVDARTIRPGAALMNAQRASVAVVQGTGKKVVFDD
ncbi:hypothetical protein EJ06DRAFT_527613 [Trichodelitschia bisporula]|uniref:RRM domain-containing protein n=1 Tax=Trichodelitschia bisporula TaxID=703511 RepID=A0A6G1I787_9PEZI|nr:hypothetical protein EJ06DRAFT_527613 [Trichodelitschia bisporula]